MRILVILCFYGVLGMFLSAPHTIWGSPEGLPTPIYYDIGRLDSRFGLTRSELVNILKRAEWIWEKPSQKNLFIYQPGALFSINLIFDNTQSKLNQAKILEHQMGKIDFQHASLLKNYERKQKIVQTSQDHFHQLLRDYNRKVKSFNREVDRVHRKGFVSQEEKYKLKKLEGRLEMHKINLLIEKRKTHLLLRRHNKLISKINKLSRKYNEKAWTYNRKYGVRTPFVKGDFQGQAINVYQFFDKEELTLILAHEMGHSLGIDHVSGKKSLMHAFMGEQNLSPLKLTQEDRNAFWKNRRGR